MWIVTSPLLAKAQPSPEFPDSTEVEVEGETFRAFDLDGFITLLRLDLELQENRELVPNLRLQLLETELSLHSRNVAVSSLEEQLRVLQAERARLLTLWSNENEDRLYCENAPSVSSIVGWSTAAAFGLATIILGIVVASGS